LRRVLRVRGVAGEEVRGAKSDALVCVHDLLIGALVPTSRALDELRLFEWSAHHWLLLHRDRARGSGDGG
jgi:hypothetical protein